MKQDILKKYWNIDAMQIVALLQSTASCFRVQTEADSYFLKIFQPLYPSRRAILEYEICRQLNTNEIPVSEIMVTNSGQPYALHDNTIMQLQKYVYGVSPKNHSMSISLLCESSEYLGKIHTILKNTQLPYLFDANWIEKYEESIYIACYRETWEMAEKSDIDGGLRKKILKDLAFLIAFTKQMQPLSFYFEKVTYTASHGDYIPSQLLCANDRIMKIVDFANSHCVPAVLELMRFYFLGSMDTHDPYDFDIIAFSEYLRAYMKHFPLTKSI